MRAPWAGVPLPGGSPTPSGPMLMSQLTRSASVTGLPRLGASPAIAVPAVNASAMLSNKFLRIDMLGLPFGIDRPARDVVHVGLREGDDRRRGLGLAALGEQFRARRLDVAGLVPGAALQNDRLAVPAPGHAE